MTVDPHQDALDFALAQQWEGANIYIQALRDCIALGGDIGFALKQQAMVLATERPMTGGPARGADLTESFDRFARAMRRTAALAQKIEADIVGFARKPTAAATPPAPTPPLTAHPSATSSDQPDVDRAEPTAERDEPTAERDPKDVPERADDQDGAESIPDRPIPDLIEDIHRDLALADPRPAEPEPTAPPPPSPARWVYQRPPIEPAPPGVLTLDLLSRRLPGPSG